MTAEQAIRWLTLKPKDLPVFVLIATDPLAGPSISHWVREAIPAGVSEEKISNAIGVRAEFAAWPNKRMPG